MDLSVTEKKAALRAGIPRRLEAMSSSERRESDEALFTRFLSLPQVERAGTIFAFWGVPGREPDTGELVRLLAERGKTVGLPRMLPGRGMEVRRYDPDRPLVSARFGIWEPDGAAPLLRREEIDLVLVPGLCYDREGFRLGFGGGYYDRWLQDFSGSTIGLCRQTVLQDRLPREPHDLPVELVLTEAECLSVGRNAKSGD